VRTAFATLERAIPRGLATGTPIVEWWDG
jgi:hypothetical protein